MPRCDHPGATCVVGDFWTCKTAGCANGPAVAVDPAEVSDDNLTPPEHGRRWVATYTDQDGSTRTVYVNTDTGTITFDWSPAP